MKTVGIICEYNPFHLGHEKQFRHIRQLYGEDCAIVCLMSGNYVQRGQSAIFDKSLRAEAALLSGADLVLELPIPVALSSAEGFAAGGVKILSGFCDELCFGAETPEENRLMQAAQALLSPDFTPKLQAHLQQGISFPAARQKALEDIGIEGHILTQPNNILAVEYCKAILQNGSTMKPMVIPREGSYHDTAANPHNPSATSVRERILNSQDWSHLVPERIYPLFASAPIHTMAAGERAVLAKLRSMTEEEFEALPYGSEGLWRKLMHACRSCASLEEIIATTKSKRYARTRLERMILCAFLGVHPDSIPNYTRVLGLRKSGQAVLKKARQSGLFPHIGEKINDPYQLLESRCDDLYGLFRVSGPDNAGKAEKRRIVLVD